MSDVQIVRLSTGEEVVAKVTFDKGFYTLTDGIELKRQVLEATSSIIMPDTGGLTLV